MKASKVDYKTLPTTGGIYCFTNLINGKQYIGLTINISQRFNLHLKAVKAKKNNLAIYRAFNKYGFDNFEYDIVEIIDDETLLDDAEKKYIKEYNTFRQNGYNVTEGGRGVRGYKYTEKDKLKISDAMKRIAVSGRYKVYCYNIIDETIIEAVNIPELNKQLNENINRTGLHYLVTQDKYIIAHSKEILDLKIEEYKFYIDNPDKKLNGLFKSKLTEEMKQDIINGMLRKLFAEKYNIPKSTYFFYKRLLKDDIKTDPEKYDKLEFHNYYKTHTKQECMLRFNMNSREYRCAYRHDKRFYDRYEELNENS